MSCLLCGNFPRRAAFYRVKATVLMISLKKGSWGCIEKANMAISLQG